MTAARAVAGALVRPRTLAAVRGWRLAAVGVVLVFAGLAVAFAVAVPVGGAADESSHIGYARLLADHARLPGAGTPEKQQPPLYYALAAALLRAGVPVQGLRGLSVACGAATVAVTMVVARLLLPRRPWLAVVAGGLVAGLPGAVAVSGAVSDDSLAWLVGACLVALTVAVLRSERPTRGLVVAVALAVTAALLTKETDWPLAAVLLAAVAWSWGARLRIAEVATLVAVPLALAGWWFVRNLATYHALTPPLAPITHERQFLRHLAQVRGFASATVRSLFGPEAATGGPLPRSGWTSALIAVLTAAANLLGGLAVAMVVRRWRQLERRRRAVVVAMSAAVVLVAATSLANSVLVDLQPQARYLVVVAAVPATAVAWAAASLLRSRATAVLTAGLTAVLLVALDVDAVRVAAHG